LRRTTLLPLRGALDPICHEVTKAGRAWCPACMYWASRNHGIYYDRLIWVLFPIVRCPIHKVRLSVACAQCGTVQRYFHSKSMCLCWKCGDSLVIDPHDWVFDDKPGFGEEDCINLINEIAAGRLTDSVQNACKLFSDEMVELCEPLRGLLERAIPGGPRTWKDRSTPTFMTLLKRCHMTGAKVKDVLLDPLGAAHACSNLQFEKFKMPVREKPRRSIEVSVLVKRALEFELRRPPEEALDSFAKLAQQLAVSVGYMRHKEPELCKLYARRVQLQNCKIYLQKKQVVTQALNNGLADAFFRGAYRSQDELVEYLCATYSAKKHVVRKQVSAALVRANRASKVRYREELARSGLRRSKFGP